MTIAFSGLRRGLLIATIFLAGVFPTTAAPVEEKADPKSADTASDRIRKELDKPVTVDIAEQSLSLAINQLRDQTKVNLVLDRNMLNQLGFDPDSIPVTVNMKDAKLRSVLRNILAPQNLSFAVVGDSVLISTDEMCIHRQMRQRVNVDFDKVVLTTALKKLARETGTNVVFDPKIAKEAASPVTMQLEEVPYDTAVKLITEMAGLKSVRVGNVLFICSKQQANEMRQDPDFNPHVPPGAEFPGGPGGIMPGVPGFGRAEVLPMMPGLIPGPGNDPFLPAPPPADPTAPPPPMAR